MWRIRNQVICLILLLVIGFAFRLPNISQKQQFNEPQDSSVNKPQSNDFDCGLSNHFSQFLSIFGYSSYNFQRTDLRCGSFGGKRDQRDTISRTPIIFIHGTADVGYGRGSVDGYETWQTGFRSLVQYLGNQGYKQSELYITTWGSGNGTQINLRFYHAKEYVMRVRAFIQAVLDYTGASKVNIISHSMGVALARKAIKGGSAHDRVAGNYEVGATIRNRIHTFIGIAGFNLGLGQCLALGELPYCNPQDGNHPGGTPVAEPAKFLANINSMPINQGDNVYSVWSKYDDTIANQCVVWGKVTCRIPGQSGEIEKTEAQWKHYTLRDAIGPDIINLL